MKSALDSLERRSILSFDETKSAYKLHGLLADSIREQIDVTKQNYWQYIDNIKRIREYDFRKFLPFADCIGNSLCEYEITTLVDFLNSTAIKFRKTWKTDYAKRLYEKCLQITNKKLETEPNNIDYLEELSYTCNNLAMLLENHIIDYELAVFFYNTAIKIDKSIIKISLTPKYLNSLAMHYNNIANIQQDHLNNPKCAEMCYQKSIKILKILTKISRNIEYLNGLVMTYYNYAQLQHTSHNYNYAGTNYKKAIKIGEEIRRSSNKPEHLHMLSASYTNFATLLHYKNKYDSAIALCKKAIGIDEIIKDADPNCLVDWMISKDNLADLYVAIRKQTEAFKIVEEIKPIAEKLLDDYPNYGKLKQVYGWIKDTESKLDQ